MATLRFVLKRLVAQRLLGLAMVVTLAFSIGVLVAGPIYADSSREAILSSQIHTSDVTVKNMRVTKFGSGSFPYADADKDLRQSLRGIPVAQLVRQGLSNMRLSARGRSGSFQLLFRDGAASVLGATVASSTAGGLSTPRDRSRPRSPRSAGSHATAGGAT